MDLDSAWESGSGLLGCETPDFLVLSAEIEAIRGLRQALVVFSGAQDTAMKAAEYKITRTKAVLEQAEDYWRSEVDVRNNSLQTCLIDAAYAAAEGYYLGVIRE